MKKIKHTWIKLEGRRIHTKQIICYVIKRNTFSKRINREEWPWALIVYFMERGPWPEDEKKMIIYCASRIVAEKEAGKLDKIFKPK